jgi:hypothetical protein
MKKNPETEIEWAPPRVVWSRPKVRVFRDALDRAEQSATRIRVLSLGRSAGFHNGRTGTGNVYARRTPPFDRIHPLPPTPTTRRKMRKSHLIAALPLFASLASAQLVYPDCGTGWDWVSPNILHVSSDLSPRPLFPSID